MCKDVCFDGNLNTVNKFVLHANTPGHYDFARYEDVLVLVLVVLV